jgi:uncharacterized protein DUF4013
MLLEIFKDSFEYSYKDPKSIFKLGILSALIEFVIPIFFVLGYGYRITYIGLTGTINGDDPLPKFENWTKMFIDGLKVFLVRFIYLLPGTIVFLIPHQRPYGMNILPNTSLVGFEIGIIAITLLLWLIFYLFSTVAISNMVNNNGSLRTAFDFKEIITIIRSIGFLKYIKFYLGCIILGIGLVTTVFGIILLLGVSITFLLRFFFELGAYLTGGLIITFFSAVSALFLVPFFLTFESRAIGLIYNMRELE